MSCGNEPTLTAPELLLLEAVRRGESVNFLQAATPSEREVRSAAIRAILMRTDLDPKGVNLTGATITGEIDLSHSNVVVPVRLAQCSIPNGLRLEGAILKEIDLDRVISDLIYMWGAEVKGDVRLTHCTFRGPVILASAKIGGNLDFEGTQIQSPSYAILAQGAEIGGHVHMVSNFVACGQGGLGSINFHWARISGILHMSGARIDNPTGPAINAEGLNAQAVHAREGFRATGAGPRGAAVFQWANLRRLDLTDANVVNSSGPAVNADNLQADAVYMRDGFVASGATAEGALLLRNARIQGQVSMRAAQVRNRDGVGLDAEGIDVGGSALLHQGFTVSANSTNFAVRLLAAKIAGELIFKEADIVNDCGPGVLLDSIQVGRHLDLSASTSAEKEPGISLVGARIGSHLVCAGGATTVPLPTLVALDLQHSTIGGQLLLSNDYARTRDSSAGSLLELDGLIYRGVPLQITLSEYLNILAHRTPRPVTQPYRQLASAYQALGQDALVRRIGVQQQKDALRRDDAGQLRDLWASVRLLPRHLVGWFIGFGWRPFRALWWIVATFAIISALAMGLLTPARIITPPTGSPSIPIGRTLCTPVDAVRLSAEITIPLIKIGGRDRCDLNRDHEAYGFIFAVSAILQVFGWAMATLFVVGFTGIIRKL